MKLEKKIQKAINKCNTNIDNYKQKIDLIKDDTRQKSLIKTYNEDLRVEKAKLRLLKKLLEK